MPKKQGHLVIVGGPDDKVPDREILTRAAHLAGGARARVAIVAAGAKPDEEHVAALARAFEVLGVAHVAIHRLKSAADANAAAVAEAVADATCTLLVARDPQALAAALDDTETERQMHRAFDHGACLVAIGGAASALSRLMVKEGKSDIHPRAGLIALAPGLAFLDRVVIDHHFSEKQRMGRLLSIVAQSPEALGVGIDAQTALVITPNRRLEVIGRATVTILDGRTMGARDTSAMDPDQILAMGNVQLHLLPAGFSFDLQGGLPASRGVIGPKVPPTLREMVTLLVGAPPVSSPGAG